MTRPFTTADNGQRFSYRGCYGRLEFPLTDPGSTATPDEGILWFDTPNARGWTWSYVKPIDVDSIAGMVDPKGEIAHATHKTITPAQTAALIWFAEKHGRTWKSKLRDMWTHGAHIGVSADAEAEVYALRNTHGPSWLVNYQPPTPAAVIAVQADSRTAVATDPALLDAILATPHLREGLALYAFIGDIRVAAYDLPDARQAARGIKPGASYLHTTTLCSYDFTPSIVLSPRLVGRLRVVLANG